MTPLPASVLVNTTELVEIHSRNHGDKSKDNGDGDHNEISLFAIE